MLCLATSIEYSVWQTDRRMDILRQHSPRYAQHHAVKINWKMANMKQIHQQVTNHLHCLGVNGISNNAAILGDIFNKFV